MLNSSDTTTRAVFAGDGAAPVGVLLGIVAVVLIDQNRRFLVGQAVAPELRRTVALRLMEYTEVARVTYLHLEFVGPRKLYLVAAVDMTGVQPTLSTTDEPSPTF